jgi:hypothetical protein
MGVARRPRRMPRDRPERLSAACRKVARDVAGVLRGEIVFSAMAAAPQYEAIAQGPKPLPTADRLARFRDRLSLPLFAAPMFLVSGIELVAAACRNGVIGASPTENCRSRDELDRWLAEIEGALRRYSDEQDKAFAPVCPNLIVHGSNAAERRPERAAAAWKRNRHHLGRLAGGGD